MTDKSDQKADQSNPKDAPGSRLPDGIDPLLALCQHFGIPPERLKRSSGSSSNSDSQPESTVFINGIVGPILRRSVGRRKAKP